jgi:type IV pilus assembly protein PilA
MSLRSLRRGFTLIELLLVIGIIAILAAIVIVAINPTKQLGDARNAQRRSDVNTILNAVYQYALDHNGKFPGAMSGVTFVKDTTYSICKTGAASCDLDNNELALDTLSPVYVVNLPSDPSGVTTGTGTDYTLMMNASNRITIAAPLAEQNATISVTR